MAFQGWEPLRTEPVGNLQVWPVGSSWAGGACHGLLIQPLAVLHKDALLQRQRGCLIPGSSPSPTWFPKACRTSWGIRELTSQSSEDSHMGQRQVTKKAIKLILPSSHSPGQGSVCPQDGHLDRHQPFPGRVSTLSRHLGSFLPSLWAH